MGLQFFFCGFSLDRQPRPLRSLSVSRNSFLALPWAAGAEAEETLTGLCWGDLLLAGGDHLGYQLLLPLAVAADEDPEGFEIILGDTSLVSAVATPIIHFKASARGSGLLPPPVSLCLRFTIHACGACPTSSTQPASNLWCVCVWGGGGSCVPRALCVLCVLGSAAKGCCVEWKREMGKRGVEKTGWL